MERKSDAEMLSDLIDRGYEKLSQERELDIKLGELLKMMELRKKLAPDNSNQEEFWKMIESIRREVLPGGKEKKTKRVVSRKAKGAKS